MDTLTADEITSRASQLGPWWGSFKTRAGVPIGNGHVPIGTEKLTFVRDCIDKLGGSVRSAIDLGSYEGYHSIQLAEIPGIEHVVGLEGRERNAEKAKLVNQCIGYDRVHFHVYDLEQLGQAALPESGPFDLVFCAGLLYHMSKPWEVVQWMSKECSKFLFLDTHYAELPLYRCGPYLGEIYPESDTDTCGMKDHAFWPVLGDLFLMLMAHGFTPQFAYRYTAGHISQPRIWIFAEKSNSSAELNGVNPLSSAARDVIPPLAAGPQPSPFQPLMEHAAYIKGHAALRPAEARLAELQNSLSWRLTEPLRSIKRWLWKKHT